MTVTLKAHFLCSSFFPLMTLGKINYGQRTNYNHSSKCKKYLQMTLRFTFWLTINLYRYQYHFLAQYQHFGGSLPIHKAIKDKCPIKIIRELLHAWLQSINETYLSCEFWPKLLFNNHQYQSRIQISDRTLTDLSCFACSDSSAEGSESEHKFSGFWYSASRCSAGTQSM